MQQYLDKNGRDFSSLALAVLTIFKKFGSEVYRKPQRSRFWGSAGILVMSLHVEGEQWRVRGHQHSQKSLMSVLASLGLNTYTRERGGEGWDGARRWIVPRG